MSLFNTFEDTLNNPSKEIINFEEIITKPMAKYEVWQRYKLDSAFRHNIDEMRLLSSSFNYRWNKYFSSFYEKDNTEGKPKIKANIRRFN